MARRMPRPGRRTSANAEVVEELVLVAAARADDEHVASIRPRREERLGDRTHREDVPPGAATGEHDRPLIGVGRRSPSHAGPSRHPGSRTERPRTSGPPGRRTLARAPGSSSRTWWWRHVDEGPGPGHDAVRVPVPRDPPASSRVQSSRVRSCCVRTRCEQSWCVMLVRATPAHATSQGVVRARTPGATHGAMVWRSEVRRPAGRDVPQIFARYRRARRPQPCR